MIYINICQNICKIKNKNLDFAEILYKMATSFAKKEVGSVAQSVEQRTFNPLVEGSNPSRPTTYSSYLAIKNKKLTACLLFFFIAFYSKIYPLFSFTI